MAIRKKRVVLAQLPDTALAVSPPQEPKDQRQDHADHNAGYDREIKNRILAAINDIARQLAQRQIELPGQQEHHADQYDHAAQNQQRLAKISHGYILIGRAKKNVAANQREKPESNHELPIRCSFTRIRG